MNRKPIFTIVLSALLVLALFAGCEQAQLNLPKKVVSAEIIQTGDFLAGQDFDPTKFEVRVIYDDSSETRLNGGNVVTLDSGTEVVLTSTVSATAGIGVDEKPFTIAGAPVRITPVDSIAVTVPSEAVKTSSTYKGGSVNADDVKVSATYTSLFGGQSVTVDLPYKGVEATVEAKLDAALEAKTGATGTATVTASLGGKTATESMDVVYSASTSVDYSGYTWAMDGDGKGIVAYRLVPATTSNSVRYINGGAFDAASMIELYKVLTTADQSKFAYELIDNADVKYTLEDYLDADHKNNFTASQNFARVSFVYAYQTEADAPYNKDTFVTKAAYVITSDVVESDAEGIYLAENTTNTETNAMIKIDLTMDYVTALSATTNRLYIVGGTPVASDFTVKATYKSGVTADLEPTTDYTVDSTALVAGTTSVKVTLVNTTDYDKYSDAVTETNAAIRIVDNYIESVTAEYVGNGNATPKQAIGQAYKASDFEITVKWVKNGADDPKPAVSYTFSAAPTKVATDNEVTITYSVPSIGQTGTTKVSDIESLDIPSSITFVGAREGAKFSVGSAPAKGDFVYNVIWASGLREQTNNGRGFNVIFTAPDAYVAGSNTVTGTWETFGWKGNIGGSATVTAE